MNPALIKLLQLLEPVALQAAQELIQLLADHVQHAAATHPSAVVQPVASPDLSRRI